MRDLLEFCAYYNDRGPLPSLEVWADGLDCAWVPNLSLDEAQAAVAEHYRCTPVRVTAADILQRVRDDRMAAAHPGGMPRMGVPPNEAYRQARAELEARLAAATGAGRKERGSEDALGRWMDAR